MSFETLFFSVRGLPLAYHLRGDLADRSKPLVLFFHGFLDHGHAFAPTVDLLDDAVTSVLVDFRGHGHSGWVGSGGYYHFSDYFHDVRVLLDTIAPDRSVQIVAHSMGGSVAMGISTMFPDRVEKLVLLEGIGPPFESASVWVEKLQRWSNACTRKECAGDVSERRAARSKIKDLGEAAARMQVGNPRLTHEMALRLSRTFTEAEGEGLAWRFDPLHRTPASRPYMAELVGPLIEQVSVPIVSLFGEKSVLNTEEFADRHGLFQNIERHEIKGAGHNLHHEQPQEIAAWIKKSLL